MKNLLEMEIRIKLLITPKNHFCEYNTLQKFALLLQNQPVFLDLMMSTGLKNLPFFPSICQSSHRNL